MFSLKTLFQKLAYRGLRKGFGLSAEGSGQDVGLQLKSWGLWSNLDPAPQRPIMTRNPETDGHE